MMKVAAQVGFEVEGRDGRGKVNCILTEMEQVLIHMLKTMLGYAIMHLMEST